MEQILYLSQNEVYERILIVFTKATQSILLLLSRQQYIFLGKRKQLP